MEVTENLIDRLHNHFTGGDIHFSYPSSSFRTPELDLVHGVLQMMQGLSSAIFYWDKKRSCFRFKTGIHVAHFSQTSLYGILDQFSYAATCLQLVDKMLNKIEKSDSLPSPTLRAFAGSSRTWLNMMRDCALKEESKVKDSNGGPTPTILGLSCSLSSLCSGAEYLFQLVFGAIPQFYFEVDPRIAAADISVDILNHIYVKFSEVCLLQGGQEDIYKMFLYIFVGTLLPYVENLDSWLFQGTLDDPFEEMFFVYNKKIAIHESEFWEKSYQPRSAISERANIADALLSSAKENKDFTRVASISLSGVTSQNEENRKYFHVCPFFIKDIAKRIISTGKSLQLIQHGRASSASGKHQENTEVVHNLSGLSLSEAFCISLVALIDHGDHVSERLWGADKLYPEAVNDVQEANSSCDGGMPLKSPKTFWNKLLDDTLAQKRNFGFIFSSEKQKYDNSTNVTERKLPQTCCRENPSVTVCHRVLEENKHAWQSLNVSKAFCLPPLNDVSLRRAIFGDNGLIMKSTDCMSGFHFSDSEYFRFLEDAQTLEDLLPCPTLLPFVTDGIQISEMLPFQNNSTLPSSVLHWIQKAELKTSLLPSVILQECLIFYIRRQADYIGRTILKKLLHDWRLLDELCVLRAIYLLGSGDLLQHFLSVIFNKLDKGETLDDDFELNTVLQESIRYSADRVMLSSADSLVISVAKNPGLSEDKPRTPSASVSSPRKGRRRTSRMDALESLKFTYKVSWPLELIANSEALKKYNQVMIFLLKVKRAKYVLDKARKWMWKDRGTATTKSKRHWLLEHKMLHFVNAFQQYVMDRVYHNAWRELQEGVAAAGTLDEAIEVHESYLQSIQRQCFVVPDKLGGLIASRINMVLGLALDFYSIQHALSSSGGAISAVKARWEKEVEQIEKQFNDCMAFLLRILSVKLNVGQFPHLAALVTRINYNCFYMSDSGILASTSTNAPPPRSGSSRPSTIL